MNILKKFFSKVLVLFFCMIFVESVIGIIEKLQSMFKFPGNAELIFLPIYAIIGGLGSYAIKSKKNNWVLIISLFMFVIAPIIGLYTIFGKYISLTTYLFFTGLFLISGFTIIYFTFKLPNSKLNDILVNQNNPELFIEKVDKLIRNSKDKDTKYRWYLEKVRALVMQKKFKESIDILQEVELDLLESRTQNNYYVLSLQCYVNLGDFKEANNILNKYMTIEMKSKKLQVYYINTLLYNLVLMERLDEAEAIFNQNSSILYNNSIEVLKTAIKDTIATYKYYCGNIHESKKLFLELDENEQDDNKKESVNYFLGLIFLSEGKEIEAKKRFEKVLEIDKGGYFYNKVIEKQYFKVNAED